MNLILKNKVALITGGANRVGQLIAEHLAKRGCNIALHYNTSKSKAEVLQKKLITTYGIKCKLFHLDFLNSNNKIIETFWNNILESFNNLDILINSASLFKRNSFTNFQLSIHEDLFKINFHIPVYLSSLFANYNKNKQVENSGVIINILDSNIVTDRPIFSSYLLAKKSLAEFTKMSALEYAPFVRINGLAPSLILPKVTDDPKMLNSINKKIPLDLKYEERQNCFIESLIYLIQTKYITGEIIFIDGGEHLRK